MNSSSLSFDFLIGQEVQLWRVGNANNYCWGSSGAGALSHETLVFALTCLKSIEASKVSNEFRLRHPEVPWEVIIRTRNRLIHGYFDINVSIVWETVETNLPSLQKLLQRVLDKQQPKKKI